MESESSSQDGDYSEQRNNKKTVENEKAHKHIKKPGLRQVENHNTSCNSVLVCDLLKPTGLFGTILLCNDKPEPLLQAYNLAFLLPIGFIVCSLWLFGVL